MTYATAIHALVDRGKLRAGQTLLVLGAAGGVGIAAVEIGKALGARVIAAVSSDEKAAGGARRGRGRGDRLSGRPIRPRRPKGACRSCSRTRSGRPAPTSSSIRSAAIIARRRCAASPGKAASWSSAFRPGSPRLPLNLTLLKSCDVCGVFWGAFAARDPQANAAHVEQLFRWWGEGRIAPRISATYPLERAGEAIAALRDRRAVGKLVVTL